MIRVPFPGLSALLLSLLLTAALDGQASQTESSTRFVLLDSTTAIATLGAPITITITNLPLRDAITSIAKQAGLSFTFDPALPGLERRVTLPLGPMRVAAAILRVLEGSGIQAMVSPSSQVVLVARPRRRARPLVAGMVVGSSLAPVRGARVELIGTRFAAVSGEDGAFVLGNVPAGAYEVRAMRMGFRPRSDPLTVAEDGEIAPLRIEMEPAAVPLDQVVVTPGYFGIMQQSIPTPYVMTRQQIETVPQIGEDVYRAINRLPGVAASDFSAKLSVRGGTGDQLYVALDGLPLVEPFHLKDIGGALSIIDMQVLGGAELTTGGASSEYGDHVAGVFDMHSLDPRTDRARTSVGISIMNARAMSQGGFAGGRGGWLVSGRRGYLDVALRLTNAADSLQPRYNDLFGKLQYDLGGGRVAAHVLHSGDKLKYLEANAPGITSQYGSDYAWLTWEQRLGSRVRERSVGSIGRLTWNRDGAGQQLGTPTALVSDHRWLEVAGFRQDWSVDLAARALLKVGVDLRRERADYDYLRWVRRETLDASKQIVVSFDTVVARLAPTSNRLGAYLAQRLRPIDAVTMEVGLRYDRASHTGDAIFSPRFNASWQASPRTTIRAAWGTYVQSQSLFGLQAEDGVVRFAPAERAEQRVVGVEQALGRGIAARAEVYDRLVSHQRPRYVNAGSAIDMFPELSFDRVLIAPTNGRARGVELSLARDAGMRVDWSLSYVLASVTDSVQGRRVPGSLDQRHAVHADWSYHPWSNRWRLSVAGMWHSGWPYTPEAVSIDTVENSSTRLWLFNVWSPGLLYSARVPAYQRIDVRWTRFFDTSGGRIALFLEVFNILNTENPRGFYTNVDVQNRAVRLQHGSRNGIPRLPSAGINWEF